MLVEKQNSGYVELTLKCLSVFMLTVLVGCSTISPPVLEGYEVLGYRQPEVGELMWSGGSLVITNTGYKCQSWVVKKK